MMRAGAPGRPVRPSRSATPAARAARCRNCLRLGSFIWNLPLRSHHSITSSAWASSEGGPKPGFEVDHKLVLSWRLRRCGRQSSPAAPTPARTPACGPAASAADVRQRADTPHLLALLRPCRQRPRRRRAAQQRAETPPSNVDCHATRSCRRSRACNRGEDIMLQRRNERYLLRCESLKPPNGDVASGSFPIDPAELACRLISAWPQKRPQT